MWVEVGGMRPNTETSCSWSFMSISYPPVEITIVTVSMNDIFVPGRLRRSVSVTCALWPGPTESTAGSRSSESGLKER